MLTCPFQPPRRDRDDESFTAAARQHLGVSFPRTRISGFQCSRGAPRYGIGIDSIHGQVLG